MLNVILLQLLFFRNNTLLQWVVLSHNNIESLEGQLPDFIANYKLAFLDVSFNKLSSFPNTFVEFYNLNTLMATKNSIRSLDGIFRDKHEIMEIDLAHNQIERVSLLIFDVSHIFNANINPRKVYLKCILKSR